MRKLLPLLLLPLAAAALAQPAAAPIAYPETARGDVVEEQFGERVADPYRWLENDVREDPRVRDWVTAQNQVTDAYLATLARPRRLPRADDRRCTITSGSACRRKRATAISTPATTASRTSRSSTSATG